MGTSISDSLIIQIGRTPEYPWFYSTCHIGPNPLPVGF
jgi:hypothetical protein